MACWLTAATCHAIEGVEVTAQGSAAILSTEEVARAAALQSALRRAVEIRLGAIVKSHKVIYNTELLSDVINTQAAGIAEIVSHREWRDGDTMRSEVTARVSTHITELMQTIAQPHSVVLALPEEIRAGGVDLADIKPGSFALQVRATLVERGFEVRELPADYQATVLGLLEELAFDPVVGEEEDSIQALVRSSQLADIFVTGDITMWMRKADIPGLDRRRFTLELGGDLRALQIENEDGVLKIVSAPPAIHASGIDRRQRPAVTKAVKNSRDEIEDFVDEIEERVGPPARWVVVYATGLHDMSGYENFLGFLRQFADFGVAEVKGRKFSPLLGKAVLTMSEQSLVTGDLGELVQYLADAIDTHDEYTVKKQAARTLLVDVQR